jgi:hypothetical protein
MCSQGPNTSPCFEPDGFIENFMEPEVCWCVHRGPILHPVLNQMDSLQILWNQRFADVFTGAQYFTLFWTKWIHCKPSQLVLICSLIYACAFCWSFLFRFPAEMLHVFLIFYVCYMIREPGTSVSIVPDYGLDDRAIEVRSPAETTDFSSTLCVQTGSGAHSAPCTMGTGGPFPGAKVRPRRDAATHAHLVPRWEWVGAILPLPPSAFLACSGTALTLSTRSANKSDYEDGDDDDDDNDNERTEVFGQVHFSPTISLHLACIPLTKKSRVEFFSRCLLIM